MENYDDLNDRKISPKDFATSHHLLDLFYSDTEGKETGKKVPGKFLNTVENFLHCVQRSTIL